VLILLKNPYVEIIPKASQLVVQCPLSHRELPLRSGEQQDHAASIDLRVSKANLWCWEGEADFPFESVLQGVPEHLVSVGRRGLHLLKSPMIE
jgi:hypothetical protein